MALVNLGINKTVDLGDVDAPDFLTKPAPAPTYPGAAQGSAPVWPWLVGGGLLAALLVAKKR